MTNRSKAFAVGALDIALAGSAFVIDLKGEQDAPLENILVGGLIGWGIGFVSGADNPHGSPINIARLPRNGQSADCSGTNCRLVCRRHAPPG